MQQFYHTRYITLNIIRQIITRPFAEKKLYFYYISFSFLSYLCFTTVCRGKKKNPYVNIKVSQSKFGCELEYPTAQNSTTKYVCNRNVQHNTMLHATFKLLRNIFNILSMVGSLAPSVCYVCRLGITSTSDVTGHFRFVVGVIFTHCLSRGDFSAASELFCTR